MRTTTFKIEGVAVGTMWLPPVEGFKEISFAFSKTDKPWHRTATTIREALESLDRHEGGDFQNTRYDGALVITHHYGNRLTQRWFDLRIFKSIQDYLTEEPFIYPQFGEEEYD